MGPTEVDKFLWLEVKDVGRSSGFGIAGSLTWYL